MESNRKFLSDSEQRGLTILSFVVTVDLDCTKCMSMSIDARDRNPSYIPTEDDMKRILVV